MLRSDRSCFLIQENKHFLKKIENHLFVKKRMDEIWPFAFASVVESKQKEKKKISRVVKEKYFDNLRTQKEILTKILGQGFVAESASNELNLPIWQIEFAKHSIHFLKSMKENTINMFQNSKNSSIIKIDTEIIETLSELGENDIKFPLNTISSRRFESVKGDVKSILEKLSDDKLTNYEWMLSKIEFPNLIKLLSLKKYSHKYSFSDVSKVFFKDVLTEYCFWKTVFWFK